MSFIIYEAVSSLLITITHNKTRKDVLMQNRKGAGGGRGSGEGASSVYNIFKRIVFKSTQTIQERRKNLELRKSRKPWDTIHPFVKRS